MTEKPIDIRLDNIDEMIRVTRQNGTRLGVIFQRRTVPALAEGAGNGPGWQAGQDGPRRRLPEVLPRPGVLRQRRLARNLGAGRRRRADEPGRPPGRPAPVDHGAGGHASSASPTTWRATSRWKTPLSSPSSTRAAPSGRFRARLRSSGPRSGSGTPPGTVNVTKWGGLDHRLEFHGDRGTIMVDGEKIAKWVVPGEHEPDFRRRRHGLRGIRPARRWPPRSRSSSSRTSSTPSAKAATPWSPARTPGRRRDHPGHLPLGANRAAGESAAIRLSGSLTEVRLFWETLPAGSHSGGHRQPHRHSQ